MSQENVEFVRRSFMTFQSGDLDAAFEFVDPQVELVSRYGTMEGRTYKGIAGLRQYVADIDEAWETYDRELVELIDAGDAVLAILDLNAVSRATGVPLRQRIVFGYWLRDGLIVRMVSYPTLEEARETMGLSE